ncbi:uncharacterized protein LOC124454912 [Xenia sp. Carnegie-2017]|uniref:uncharacterized protein LOC124454912 n=1 Tax=Xenia sp. Carnegie-2017 TaxID=2897299 RepID=UPI001F04BC83|nr:uncharacterized protein LOC124454912 [Xenia sp. Carnegie-2017]
MSGKDLASVILKCLNEELVLNIQDCRGQGYDGAEAVAECINGLAARIKNLNEKAIYTHFTQLLQSFSNDIADGLNLIEALKKLSRTVRNEVDVYHANWYSIALTMAEKVGVEEKKPRTCGRQAIRSNVPSESVSDYFKKTITIPLADHLCSELEKRHVIEKSQSPVFICHNDVQPGNLLMKAKEDLDEAKIRVTDFEYSCYNYRGYDIGNHFSEWIFDYDHPHYPFFTGEVTKYPSYDQEVFFVRAYLQAYNETTDVTLDEIEKVIDEADRLSLLSHFFWAMFSILQSYKSSINFGYLEYALFRMECLNHFRHFSEEKPGDKLPHDNGKIHCDV